MLLIDADSNQLGDVPLARALAIAEEAGFDLVEVSPHSNPPVCRVMDYGKYQYPPYISSSLLHLGPSPFAALLI